MPTETKRPYLAGATLFCLLLASQQAGGHGNGEHRLSQLNVRLEARPLLVAERMERAVLLANVQEFDRAWHDISLARLLTPAEKHDPMLHVEVTLLQQAGQLKRACGQLVMYLQRRPATPQSAPLLERLAGLQLALREEKQAMSTLDQLFLLSARPQPDLLLQRVKLAERHEGPLAALHWVTQRLEKLPAGVPVLVEEAVRLEMATGHYQQAWERLKKQTAQQPGNLKVSLDLVRVLRRLGKPKEADAVLAAAGQRLTQLSPPQKASPLNLKLALDHQNLLKEPHEHPPPPAPQP